jgi:AAHS family benzoate transporter-like MFS transporter
MTIESAIASNEPPSGDVEISASTSFLVVALCWIGIFTEGYDVGVLGAVSASLILTGYLADYLAPFARSARTGFALSFARIGLLGPLLGGYIASRAVGAQWNFYVFAVVAAIAAVATALIPNK